MSLCLIVANGRKAGQVIPVKGKRFLIGRADDCHIRLHSETVSRYHCAIIAEEGEDIIVYDLGSKNGVHVNGQRIPPDHEQVLKDGDRLKVGILVFDVRFSPELAEKDHGCAAWMKDTGEFELEQEIVQRRFTETLEVVPHLGDTWAD
ncbi:MAG: FHA domain-containing protein [Thermoguttaceae bacterium]